MWKKFLKKLQKCALLSNSLKHWTFMVNSASLEFLRKMKEPILKEKFFFDFGFFSEDIQSISYLNGNENTKTMSCLWQNLSKQSTETKTFLSGTGWENDVNTQYELCRRNFRFTTSTYEKGEHSENFVTWNYAGCDNEYIIIQGWSRTQQLMSYFCIWIDHSLFLFGIVITIYKTELKLVVSKCLQF